MRVLFDTSVLVAGFVASHPKNHVAFNWLKRAKKKEVDFFVSAHSVAECYAVLTRLPLSPKISPDAAQYLIHENIESLAEVVSLSGKDYFQLMKQMAVLGLSGGMIYDAITLRAAKNAKVDKVLTFNVRDFIRLVPQNPEFILSP